MNVCSINQLSVDTVKKLRGVLQLLTLPTKELRLQFIDVRLEANRQVKLIYQDYKEQSPKDDFERLLFKSGLSKYNFEYKQSSEGISQLQLEKLSIENMFETFDEATSAFTYVSNFFTQKVTLHTFLNKSVHSQVHYVSTAQEFNIGVVNFKNELTNLIAEELGIELTRPIFTIKDVDTEAYINLMQKAGTLFISTFNIKGDIIANKRKFDVFAAIYILNNFDTMMEEALDGVISIVPTSKGTLGNTQYAKKINAAGTSYWLNDTHEDKNADKFMSNITKFLIRQVPKVEKLKNGQIVKIEGKFLDSSDLFLMAGVLKQAEYEYNLLHPGKTINFFEDLKRALKTLLNLSDIELLQIPVLEKFLDQLLSLKTYLYTGITGEEYSIEQLYSDEFPCNTDVLDIEGLFAFEIGKTVAPTYISYDQQGIPTLLNYSQAYDNSQRFVYNIEGFFYNDADSDDPILTKKIWFEGLKSKSFSQLKSDPIFQTFCSELLDITVTPESSRYDKFFTSPLKEGEKYTRLDFFKDLLINMSTQAISRNLEEDEKLNASIQASETVISSFNRGNKFHLFKQASNLFFIDTPRTTFKDAKGNTIPVYRLNSAMMDDSYFILTYRENFEGQDPELHNLFIMNPHLLSALNVPHDSTKSYTLSYNANYSCSTVIKLDAGEGDDSQSANKLSVPAQAIASFIGDYLGLEADSPSDNVMGVLIACYSDKSSILLKLVNLAALLKIPYLKDKTITLEELMKDPDLVLQLDYFYRKNLTLKLMNDILKTWSKIVQLIPGNKYIIQYLSDDVVNKLTKDAGSLTLGKNNILVLWQRANETIKELSKDKTNWKEVLRIASLLGLELAEELHYSKYKVGEDSEIRLNNAIYYDATGLINFKAFKNRQYKHFLHLKTYPVKIKGKDATLFDLLKNKVYNAKSKNTSFGKRLYGDKTFVEDSVIEKALMSYLFTSNLIRHLYLDMTVKEPYLDPAKGAILKEVDYSGKGISYEEYAGAREFGLRMDSSQKRMVIYPGTVENYLLNTFGGVGKTVKVAIIEDAEEEVFNAFGSKTDQAIFDGCGFISPYQSRMENASLIGKGATETKKTLGMSISKHTSSLFKWAEMILNNWKIRQSIGCKYDLERLFKKMHSGPDNQISKDIDLTTDFLGEHIDIQKLVLNRRIFYKKGFRHFEILDIIRIAPGIYTLKVNEVDSQGNKLQSWLDGVSNININSIYDLWKALGSYNSEELSESGTLIPSEINNDLIYGLITHVGHMPNPYATEYNQLTIIQPLRDSFIGIWANKGSVKRGIINLNSKKEHYDYDSQIPLSFFRARTSMFGQLLDANHEADESEITELSQTMSALAALGYTSVYAQEAYDEIARVIENSISKLNKEIDLDNTETIMRRLSKRLMEELARDKKINLAQSIIQSLLKEELNPILPFSDSNFYRNLTKLILSDLNKSSLKRKYQGLAGILNPSSNILQLYRINGKNYLFEDLITAADAYTESDKQAIEDAIEEANSLADSDEYIFNTNKRSEDQLTNPHTKLLDENKVIAKMGFLLLKNPQLKGTLTYESVIAMLKDEIGENNSGIIPVSLSEVFIGDYVYDPATGETLLLADSKLYNNFIWNHRNDDKVLKDISYPTDLRPQLATFEVQITPELSVGMHLYQTPAASMAFILNDKLKEYKDTPKDAIREDGELQIIKCQMS